MGFIVELPKCKHTFIAEQRKAKTIFEHFPNGLSIKDFRSQREERFVQCGHFSVKGVLQMRTLHFFVQKNSDFSKYMVCPHR